MLDVSKNLIGDDKSSDVKDACLNKIVSCNVKAENDTHQLIFVFNILFKLINVTSRLLLILLNSNGIHNCFKGALFAGKTWTILYSILFSIRIYVAFCRRPQEMSLDNFQDETKVFLE